MKLTFNDVIIEPTFSTIRSRNECDTSVTFQNHVYSVPVISSNMDTVTDAKMANALGRLNVLSALHRFCNIEENVSMYQACEIKKTVYASVGVGTEEQQRFNALYDNGCRKFVVDVAHGASIQVIEMLEHIQKETGTTTNIIVGNFASARGVKEFETITAERGILLNYALKIGVGPGSMCTTRVVTGCGYPQISAIQEIKTVTHRPIIADGGIKSSGDIAKALAAGADLVMLGGMLAGTDETPGNIFGGGKVYRGSASKESYEVQGKVATHRTPEGEATIVPNKGSVVTVIQQIEAGLKSSMSYVGTRHLEAFKESAKLVQISQAGYREGEAHGK